MIKTPYLIVALSILALTLSTLACGASSPSQPVEEQSGQSAPATEAPVSEPAGNGSDASATIPCAQLISPDEMNLLLNNAPTTLSENVYPGTSTCTWQYTPIDGSSQSFFQVQADFNNTAVVLWEAARQTEFNNEDSDTVVVSIPGLGDENYTWVSQPSNMRVVYVRKGNKTLIMRFEPQEILFLQTESGIIDYADRIFNRY
jgi:hypothetical protein